MRSPVESSMQLLGECVHSGNCACASSVTTSQRSADREPCDDQHDPCNHPGSDYRVSKLPPKPPPTLPQDGQHEISPCTDSVFVGQ